MKVASLRIVREIEAAANRSGLSYQQMMRNAGRAASGYLRRRCALDSATRITFLIGKGNNGGDGLVMANDLATSTDAVIALYLLEPRAAADENFQAAASLGLSRTQAAADPDGRLLRELVIGADIIVDALLGIGLRLPLQGLAASTLKTVNDCLREMAAAALDQEGPQSSLTGPSSTKARPYILALDCPSGINCDTGEADDHVISADSTISFIAGKPGLFTFPAAGHVGELTISRIGISEKLPELDQIKATVVDPRLATALLPPRPLSGHKGIFGKVMVVAGSRRYIGAIALAGEAAYRAGAGLVTIASTARLIDIVAGGLREPTWLPLDDVDGSIAAGASETVIEQANGYNALLLGCGLGSHESTRAFMRDLLARATLPGLVIDADGLNILGELPRWWQALPDDTILTPHPGEMARLTGKSAQAINRSRWTIARECAAKWNVVLVLKGAHTLIAAPDGRVSVIPIKTDALSTAGTGDVLAGLIAGLRGQGLNAFDSARLGAYVHALAGLMAAESLGSSRSVIAGDVLSMLGRAFSRLESP
ncbi:MAG: NAD(P)H-hydrate dehydratase [Chloroflexota bacterium]|nr:NAD(P)H-hydrate dehydratase [Chloroflexota bacterium]MDE2946380.1 NAD(P)H-hydrate dehydratase [Chloroflexota bacterium]